jgi:prepilin-type N-terminal cleavage/methylation domain-containing protein
MKNLRNGFSLAEVILVLAISTIVGVLLLSILVNSTGVFYTETSKVDLGVSANDSLVKMRGYIKEAVAVATSNPIGSPTFTTGTNTLVLKIPALDSSGNIISKTYDYVAFYKSGDKFYIKTFLDASSHRMNEDMFLTSAVNNLVFDYYDSAGVVITPVGAVKVKATIVLAKKAGAGTETNIATSEANLRND